MIEILQLQLRANHWNRDHPIGTPVHYRQIPTQEFAVKTRTRSVAFVAKPSSTLPHHLRIFVDDELNSVPLDYCSLSGEAGHQVMPSVREALDYTRRPADE